MRRFLTLVVVLFLAVPAGITISGCTRNPSASYCNGAGYGLKLTAVASIKISPATTGISIAYGQTTNLGAAQSLNCKGTPIAATGGFSYGSTNLKLVDISPTGIICAGTWNRNTGGGIADYTICSKPDPLPANGYATAYVTASAQTVSSNPVQVYVHAPVTSVSLVTTPISGTGQQCYSQGQQATLDAQACYADSGNNQVLLCAPASVTSSSSPTLACPLPTGVALSSIPSCTASIGTLSYAIGNTAIASLLTDTTSNTVTITSEQPGTTAITASVAGSGSSAGYFTACPPASISLSLPNTYTTGTVTQGISENLTETATDSYGNPLNGLILTYQSTDPIDITASGTGSITTAFPGVASVYALCQPPSCNPSPINQVGLFGTGLPVSSNAVTITTPGTSSDYVWFSAPGQSQFFGSIDLLTGTVGSSNRLPYVPNSMVMDRLGNNLYFGSPHELMIVNTSNNALNKEVPSVPGVVLAVSPNNGTVLVNDQARQLFYLYNVASGNSTTFSGMGNAAAWTPDSNTLYISDSAALNSTSSGVERGITGHTDTLYVYNASTGWITSPLPPSPVADSISLPPGILPSVLPPNPMPPNVAISSTVQTPAITNPSVGAYLRGEETTAHTWCPDGTVGNYSSMTFYPLADSLGVQSDALAATTDGQHVLTASLENGWGAPELTDINLAAPPYNCLPPVNDVNYPLAAGDTLSPLIFNNTFNTTPLTGIYATAINQVIASPESNLAFITYTSGHSNSNATLPYYQPNPSAPGTLGALNYLPLAGGSSILAPLAGAFTPDDKIFFVSTAGDNKIHYISIPLLSTNPAGADTQQISPNLPACTPISSGGTDPGCTYSFDFGTIVPATVIVVKPRPTT